MHKTWDAPRVMAALKALRNEGMSVREMTRLSGANRSTVYRWMSGGEGQPDYILISRLARAIWPRYPELARELVEASGWPWMEPSEEEQPPPDPLADLLGSAADAEEVRRKIRRHKGADAEWYISALEDALRPPAGDAGQPPGRETG